MTSVKPYQYHWGYDPDQRGVEVRGGDRQRVDVPEQVVEGVLGVEVHIAFPGQEA
jgi:hypothetical protein